MYVVQYKISIFFEFIFVCHSSFSIYFIVIHHISRANIFQCKKGLWNVWMKNKILINVINVAYQYLLFENNTFRCWGIKRKTLYQNKSQEAKHMIKCPIYHMCRIIPFLNGILSLMLWANFGAFYSNFSWKARLKCILLHIHKFTLCN